MAADDVFRVTFHAENTEWLVNNEGALSPGLDDLDFIREKKNLPLLPMNSVGQTRWMKCDGITLVISEEDARSTGYFKISHRWHVRVTSHLRKLPKRQERMESILAPPEQAEMYEPPFNCFLTKGIRRQVTPPFQYFIEYGLDGKEIFRVWKQGGYGDDMAISYGKIFNKRGETR